jgi:hypothetical protein
MHMPAEDQSRQFSLDTDEAIIYEKATHQLSCYNTNNQRQAVYIQENPRIETTILNACMAIYIETPDKVIALHVSPSQAADTVDSVIKAYEHLKNADLPKETEISVIIGGHTDNFEEKVFRNRMQEMGLDIKQLIKGNNPPGLLKAEFDIGVGDVLVAKIGANDNDPNKYERLSFPAKLKSSSEEQSNESILESPPADEHASIDNLFASLDSLFTNAIDSSQERIDKSKPEPPTGAGTAFINDRSNVNSTADVNAAPSTPEASHSSLPIGEVSSHTSTSSVDTSRASSQEFKKKLKEINDNQEPQDPHATQGKISTTNRP